MEVTARTYTQEEVDAAVAARLEADSAGLRRSREKIQAELNATIEKLKPFEGIDPEEAKRLLAGAPYTEPAGPTAAERLAALEAEQAAELAAVEARTAKQKLAAERYAVEAVAVSLLVAEGVADPAILMPHLERVLRHDADSDETFVVDDAGKRRHGVTPAMAVAQLRERFGDEHFPRRRYRIPA
jgi:hypothetical protein